MFDDLKDRGRTLEGIELGPVDPLAPSGAAGSHDSGSGAKRVRGQEPRLKRPRSNRTGGPRSAEGIARASQNSLTHGAYATVIPESVEYLSYLDKAQQALRPSGLVEGELSASIAFSALKAQRLRDIELGRIARSARRGINTVELAKRVGFPWPGVHHELLAEPVNDTLLQRTVFDGWRRLAAPPPTLTPDEGVLSTPDQRVAAIYAEACTVLSTRGLVQLSQEEFFMRLDGVMLEARSGASYLGQRVSNAGEDLFFVHYWLYRNAARVNACAQEMMEDLLIDVYTDERLMRANAHVSSRMRNDIDTLQTVKDIKGRRAADCLTPAKRKGR